MAKRSGAVHVARIVSRYKEREYVSHLLRRTYREGGRVRHETVGNISHLPAQVIDLVRRALKGEAFVAASERMQVVRTAPHGHVAAIAAMARKLEVPRLLGPDCKDRDLVLALVIARICRPGSKLATTRWWQDTTMAEDLDISEATTDDVYAAMDWLGARQARIESALARRHLKAGDLALYDLSSSYYEGRCCPLASLGFPRDRKRGIPQINYGLLTDRDGRPISIEVFAGNTADPTALMAVADKLKGRFGLEHVVMVGDRGMITQARIDALKELGGIAWITAMRAPQIQALADAGAIQMSLFDDANLAEISHPDYPGERLVCCKNPLVAAERKRKRAELLDATEKELKKIADATTRARQPLRGKDNIGIRVGKVINKHKVGKHFELDIHDDSLGFSRRREGIDREAALDGVYVVRTNVAADNLKVSEVVEAYKRLACVEQDFRSLKSVDLELRPIRHRLKERVEAHALICMLAEYIVWHLRKAWSPLTFTDEAPPPRDDPVAAAERSAAAHQKSSRRRTSDGEPAHSFSTLLDHLGAIARADVRVIDADDRAVFQQLPTELTTTQRKAFELIGVPLPLRVA